MAEHLSEEQLARFQDGELSPREAAHLERCLECNSRLRDLQAVAAAYAEYRDSFAPPPVPKPWRSLAALHGDREVRHPWWSWTWWKVAAAAAAVCAMVATVTILQRPAPLQANELLTRSANGEVPSNRMISMRLNGRTLLRPAVLVTMAKEQGDMAHLRNLFAEANYDWRAPLSARSFQGWRSALRDRQDTVSVIDAGGPEEAYRVRTATATGVLRSASLTLRGKALRATNGSFQFQGEAALEVEEAPAPDRKTPSPVPAPREDSAPETPASAADTLHVLAALNEIGADVTDPIVLTEDDRRQVVVRATALSASRRQEVAAALNGLPHVRLDLDASPSISQAPPAPAPPAQRFSTGMPEALRRQMETLLGGASALQEITDSVLDASSLAVARTHALETLAGKFPPEQERQLSAQDRELLHTLRQRHGAELERLTARIRAELKPLLSGAAAAIEAPNTASWQARIPALVAAAQKLDNSLNRLLAGSYSQPQGEGMLRELNSELVRLERAVPLQQDRVR